MAWSKPDPAVRACNAELAENTSQKLTKLDAYAHAFKLVSFLHNHLKPNNWMAISYFSDVILM